MTLTSKESSKTITDLNEKVLGKLTERGIKASNLVTFSSNLSKTENKSQFILVIDCK